MSNKLRRRLFAALLCILLALTAILPAGADFGDFSGDSDWGSS